MALFVALTSTPGNTAPVASLTVPLTLALLDCPNAGPARQTQTHTHTDTHKVLFIDPPELSLFASSAMGLADVHSFSHVLCASLSLLIIQEQVFNYMKRIMK